MILPRQPHDPEIERTYRQFVLRDAGGEQLLSVWARVDQLDPDLRDADAIEVLVRAVRDPEREGLPA